MKIKVRVKPNSNEQSVQKIILPGFDPEEGEIYFVKLKSPAENNNANLELIKLLEKHFNTQIRIRAGFNSKNKIVEVLE